MGVSPTSLTEASMGTGLNRDINIGGFEKGVGLKDLAVMARQMSTMTSSGLSLIRTLAILSEQTENKKLARTLDEVKADVEAGYSLSTAMGKHITVFPPLMVNLVRTAETGGLLEGTLVSMIENYTHVVKLR